MTKNSLTRALIFALALVTTLLSIPVLSSAEGAPVAYIIQEPAEVTRDAYPGALILGRLEPGAKVYGLLQDGDMLQIAFEGVRAWIPMSAVALPEPEPAGGPEPQQEEPLMAMCTADGLKLRGGPGTKYEQLAVMPIGAQVTVLSLGNNWHKIEYKGQQGWALASQLKLYGATLYPAKEDPVTYQPLKGKSQYLVLINIETQIGCVLEKDDDGYYTQPVRSFPVSTGRNNATPIGTFEVIGRHRWQLMKGGVYTQYAVRFKGSFLLHSVPYSRKDPASLLSREYNKLGKIASSGCVRMRVEDSKWIYDNCPDGTIVQIVKDGSYPSIPILVPFESIDTSIRWDPTDPDPNNPYYDGDE